jgi:hypothetical protein
MSLLGHGFLKVRGAALSRAGFTIIKGIWMGNHFISAWEARENFGLRLQEGAWHAAIHSIPLGWIAVLTAGPEVETIVGEWMGIFANQQDTIPVVAFQPHSGTCCNTRGDPRKWWIEVKVPMFYVAALSRTLRGWSVSDRLSSAEIDPRGGDELYSKIMGSIY